MNKPGNDVTNLQLAFIIASTMLGVSMLGITHFVVMEAGTATPFASFVGILIAFIGLVGYVLIGRKFPTNTLIGYNEAILGKFIGRFFSMVIIFIFLILIGLETRQYAEAIQGTVLPKTPLQVSIILMILLCSTTSFQRVDTFAYIHFFYVPLILVPIVIVIIPAFQDIEIYHMTPILGYNPTWKGFFDGALTVTQAIGNFIVIAMVIPFMKKPKSAMKGAIWGFWIGGIIVLFTITMTIGTFGEKEIEQMNWPLLTLGRMISIPADILARIDAFLLISWIYAVFTTLLSYYFLIIRGICELLQFPHYRVVSLVVAPLVFLIAIVPSDIYSMYDYILGVTRFGILPLLVYPFLLLLFAGIFKRRGGKL